MSEAYLDTWAIAPLSVVLAEHANADRVKIKRRADQKFPDGTVTERWHCEIVYRDGTSKEITIHEPYFEESPGPPCQEGC